MKSPLLRVLSLAALAAIALFLSPSATTASPVTLNCRTGCSLQSISGDAGGALWSTGSVQPSGTGVFKPFVRIQAHGNETTEDGHNTDANGVNDEKGGTWTHSVKMTDLDNVALINGAPYYEFMLDLGEPASSRKSQLSLDAFKICTASTGNLTKVGDCPTTPYNYNMDAGADRAVLLDYNLFGGGNGNSDLFLYIPTAALSGANTYFYLYTAFGYQPGMSADGTFEEWAFQSHLGEVTQQQSTVPEPATLTLLGSGLAFAAARLRRRK